MPVNIDLLALANATQDLASERWLVHSLVLARPQRICAVACRGIYPPEATVFALEICCGVWMNESPGQDVAIVDEPSADMNREAVADATEFTPILPRGLAHP